MIEIVDISSKDLVDPLQVAWVAYKEGPLKLRVKIIRANTGRYFASFPIAYRKRTKVQIVEYDAPAWREREQVIMAAFKEHIGVNRFYDSSSAV